MNWKIALAALRDLPDLLERAEALVPGPHRGTEKKLTVAADFTTHEGALALDQRVKEAKSLLIDAAIGYANAIALATQDAQAFGVPLPGGDASATLTGNERAPRSAMAATTGHE